MKRPSLLLIRFYQLFISPLMGPSCRYHPTCSHYASEAIERFGLMKGGYLTLKRVLRCHPFCEGGYDPVPVKTGCECHDSHSETREKSPSPLNDR